jgi:hypothetical protein
MFQTVNRSSSSTQADDDRNMDSEYVKDRPYPSVKDAIARKASLPIPSKLAAMKVMPLKTSAEENVIDSDALPKISLGFSGSV